MAIRAGMEGTVRNCPSSITGLFDSKRYNIANLRLSKVQKEEMVREYLQAVQQGSCEASDALLAVTRNRDYRERHEALRRAAGQTAELSTVRYQGSVTSYLEVPRSETDLFDAELELAQAQLQDRLAVVQLYSALGGGWEQ